MQDADISKLIEFYQDRLWLVCRRRNLTEQVASILTATNFKIFHAYTHEKHKIDINTYLSKLHNFDVENEDVIKCIEFIKCENKLIELLDYYNIEYKTIWYEEVTKNGIIPVITEALGTTTWLKYYNLDNITIQTNVNYKDVIRNYSNLNTLCTS